MPLERKTDLRIIKTQKVIKDTFKQMVCEMDAAKIQVKELCERAMIHRKTFYLHYTCIEALYADVLQELSAGYYAMIDSIPADASFYEVNRVFFTFMSKIEPYMEKIVCAASYREFSDRFFLSLQRHNRARHNPYAAYTPEEQSIINTFLCVNSVNLYRQWVADGKKLPLDRLIELSGKMFVTGISSIL